MDVSTGMLLEFFVSHDPMVRAFILDGTLYHRMNHEEPDYSVIPKDLDRTERRAMEKSIRAQAGYMQRPPGVRGKLNLAYLDFETNEVVLTKRGRDDTITRVSLMDPARWVGDIVVVNGNFARQESMNRTLVNPNTAEARHGWADSFDDWLTLNKSWSTFDFQIFKTAMGRTRKDTREVREIGMEEGKVKLVAREVRIGSYDEAFIFVEETKMIAFKSYYAQCYDLNVELYDWEMPNFTYLGPNLAFSSRELAATAKKLLSARSLAELLDTPEWSSLPRVTIDGIEFQPLAMMSINPTFAGKIRVVSSDVETATIRTDRFVKTYNRMPIPDARKFGRAVLSDLGYNVN